MKDPDNPTMGDVLVHVHKEAGGDSDAGVEVLGMVLDTMMANQAHTQSMLDSFYERERDTNKIVAGRIQQVLDGVPRLGPTRDYETALSLIERALYVDYTAIEAYRADESDLSFWMPPEWQKVRHA